MRALLLLLLFCILPLYAHHNDQKLEKVTLQLHWKYQFEFAGFIAAKEKGFYRDVGLDVDLKEYENGINIIDEVLSHKAEYGIYNSSILIEYLQGKPLVLVASFFKRSALVLLAKPDIHSPKDLLGKKVMSTSMDDFDLNFKPYFNAYGVDTSKLIMVPHTFRVKEFAEGKVDAMTAFISDQPFKLDKLGVKYNVLDPSDENLFVLQEELFTSEDEAKNHPQRVKDFKDASIKGWQYALAHPQELIDIIHKKYNKHISLDALKYEAKAINNLILPSVYAIGSIEKSFLQKQKELFIHEYAITTNRDLSHYIFDDHMQDKLNFTEDEIKYIQDHKKITLCCNYGLFPLDGVKNNRLVGEMGDVFSLISTMTSLKFQALSSSSEADLYKKIVDHQCQILSVIATKNKTFDSIKMTEPFSVTAFALLSKLENSFVDDPLKLKGKVLLVQQHFLKQYLKMLYPYLSIKVVADKNKMINEVLQDKAYAIITLDEQADYLIDKYGYGKLKINGFLAKEDPLEGSIGIQKDQPILYSIIEKTLKHIPQEKIESIQNSWRISRYHTKIDYSLAFKILFFMGIIVLVMIYYQRKLKNFNKELEKQVLKKTKELREINESLEVTVDEKVKELVHKDEILTLQSKQAVMGEMIAMIAHQWRQPLNTITLQISNIQLKEMMGEDLTKEELLQTLEDISNSVVYLSNTIEDFKTYFRPDKKANEVIIRDLISKAIGFIEPRIKQNKITIDLKGDLESKVHIYTNELIQVILNIINNAIDAYESLKTEEKIICIEVKLENEELFISISDHAGGIKQEHIKQIFEPYFSTKGKNGTGLGLYMSKMIIEKQFNGKLTLSSSNGGTTFSIVIPKDVRS